MNIMRRMFWIILTFSLFSCEQAREDANENKQDFHQQNEENKMTLLDHVNLAINPKYEDWVLFENGTYIIFKADTLADMAQEAFRLMQEYGPVYAGQPAGDFSVLHLNKTDGWLVSGDCYGMYTYVNPDELATTKPNDVEIGLFGRSKRDKDGKNPRIVHINRKK